MEAKTINLATGQVTQRTLTAEESAVFTSRVPQPKPVLKRLIIERLHDAGKLDAWVEALASNTYVSEMWYASGQADVMDNDEGIRVILQSIGTDPNVILARLQK